MDTESSFTGMHLETMALRCIAQALGFGTTLMYYNSGVVVGEDQKFTNLCGDNVLCPYEKLIFEKYGTRLIDLDVTSKDFEEFVQPEDHDLRHILYSEDAFTVYSPKHFSEMKSLGMLKNPNSLMWYQMDCGDRFLDIDNITARILNEIGWNVSIQEGLKLNMYEGNNMVGPYTTTGIGNAFKKYKIVVRNDGSAANITDQSLRLRLFHKNGERYAVGINKGDTVINGTSLTLNLGKFVKEDINDQIYRITEGGELEAELVFTYSADGIRGRTKVFRIALDARPVLRDITHKGAISRGNYVDATFGLDGDGIIDAFCKISYKGYNMYRQPSRERVIDPNTKKFLYYEYKLINLHPTDTARIEIYGINNYGRSAAQKIWYFYPSNPTYNPGGLSIGLLPRPYHCIYDIAGNIVFTGNDDEYAIVRKSLKPGYYFIKHFSEDGILTEEKIKIVDR